MKYVLIIIITAILFVVAARLGYYLTFSHTVVVPLWAPAGVGLALILIYDYRFVLAGIALGSVFTSYYSKWNTVELSGSVTAALFAIVASGRMLEAFAGRRLIERWISGDIFSLQRNVFRFFFISVVISFIGASIMILGFQAFNVKMPEGGWRLFFDYAIGNVVGILLFAPLILLVSKTKIQLPDQSSLKDFMVFLALILVVVLLLQIKAIADPLMHALPFMLVPYLLWLASRYSLSVAFFGVFVSSIVALYYTVVVKEGPFIIFDSGDYSMLYLQVFITVISFSTLLLGSATNERNVAQQKLKELNENLEQKVEERTSELMKRNAELDNFVYRVSHDLRAPIASILGLINVASQDQTQISQYLDLMRKSALKQDDFIREILDHAKNSRSELRPQEIIFSDMIDQIWSSIAPADVEVKKNVSIVQKSPFISDAWRLQVIFNNLLSNSIRYRRNGTVHIGVTGTVTSTRAEILVQDQGQGIPSQHIAKVFEMFYRANDQSYGSGLGLYIVKETVEKLGGEVTIKSKLDEGTTVKVVVPSLSKTK